MKVELALWNAALPIVSTTSLSGRPCSKLLYRIWILVSSLIEQILRDDVRKPSNGSSSEQLDFSATKKTKKMYALSHEKWHLATKISPENYRQSEQNYFKFENEEDVDKKLELLDQCREFLQVQFRTMDPTNHIQGLKKFWEQPFGLDLLSAWFEWVTNGSRDGCLKKTVAENSEMVFSMIKRVLSDMKGESWDKKFEGVPTDQTISCFFSYKYFIALK